MSDINESPIKEVIERLFEKKKQKQARGNQYNADIPGFFNNLRHVVDQLALGANPLLARLDCYFAAVELDTSTASKPNFSVLLRSGTKKYIPLRFRLLYDHKFSVECGKFIEAATPRIYSLLDPNLSKMLSSLLADYVQAMVSPEFD